MRLPAAPFQEWLARKVEQYGLEELNQRVGHDLHKQASGQYRTIDLDLADEVLTAMGGHLRDLYPDLYVGDDPPLEKRRGGWTQPDKRPLYSDAQLRLLYKLHIEQGQSINQLAKATCERVGYASANSAHTAISKAWKRMGLPARDRIEQVRLTCTVHGRKPKHGSAAGYARYRRENGMLPAYRPRCQGFKSTAPRKGWPCERPAMNDSRYCLQHDPLRALEVQAMTARMRKRQPELELLPMAPFSRWLDDLASEHGSLKRACQFHGLRYDSACRYRNGEGTDGQPKTLIGRRTVERWLEPVGVDVEELYPVRERMAA